MTNEAFEEMVSIASERKSRAVMQHMMRTTGNLSELAPTFEKPRSDARAGQHDKASEAERAAAKSAFGNLVNKSDDEPESTGKPGARPENAKNQSDPGTGSHTVKGREPGTSPLGMGDAKTVSVQPNTGLQGALKFALSAADGSRDGRDGGTGRSDGQTAEPDAVSLADLRKADPSTGKESARPIDRTDVQPAVRAIDVGKNNGNEAQHGREPVATENEIPVEGRKLRDRILDGEATTQLAAAALESSGEMWAENVTPNTSRRSLESETLAPDVDDEVDTDNVSGSNDDAVTATSNVHGLLSQSTSALNQVSASLQKAAGQSVPTGEPGATSSTSNRAERNVRLVSQAGSAGRLASDLSTLPASSAMPELRARLATETATAQRALNLDDQAVEIENNIDADALNAPVRVMQQEGHLAVASDVRIGPMPVFGQLVQSLASTDGLPKLGSELRLLATQGNTSLAPEPLKVLHLQLQPRELGDLAVRIALRGDKIELRVQTQRQATANLLMSDQRLLVEALQQKNLDVDSVTIQVVEPDKNSSGQSAAMPNMGQGRSGQSDSFSAGSQGQASGQNGENGGKPETSDTERHAQQQDINALDEFGRRRGVFL